MIMHDNQDWKNHDLKKKSKNWIFWI